MGPHNFGVIGDANSQSINQLYLPLLFTSLKKNTADIKKQEDLCTLVITFLRRSPFQCYSTTNNTIFFP